MRDYAKASPALYTGKLAASLAGDMDCFALAPYLIFGPHSNMIGLYRLPLAYVCEDLGMPLARASEALRKLSERAFCKYDESAKTVWVIEYARHEWGADLNADDNRVKSLRKYLPGLLSAVANSSLVSDFFEHYRHGWACAFEGIQKPLASPSEALGKPLASPRGYQEQDQEQKQEQDQEQEKSTRRAPRASLPLPDSLRSLPISSDLVRGTAMSDARTLGELWDARMKALPRRKWPASTAAESVQHRELADIVQRHGNEAAGKAILQSLSYTGFKAEWFEKELPRNQSDAKHYPSAAAHDSPTAIRARELDAEARRKGQERIDLFEASKREAIRGNP